MKGRNLKKAGYSHPRRLSFKEDETVHPWLSTLLDAYCLFDKGISEAIGTETRKQKRVACSKGCSTCCKTHQTIPVYPLELVGLSWYVTEKVTGPEREIVKKQLTLYKENDPCPFLIHGACSVHPMRPAACRQFIVLGNPCSEGEDPYYTRRQDVLCPIKKYVDRAFFIMLPFYGIEKEAERKKLIETGAVHQLVKLMQTCNWKSLAEKMEEFDKRLRRFVS
ncbi:MAG: YkgJ family cysteine cluster protein [Nitrospirota bacterium]